MPPPFLQGKKRFGLKGSSKRFQQTALNISFDSPSLGAAAYPNCGRRANKLTTGKADLSCHRAARSPQRSCSFRNTPVRSTPRSQPTHPDNHVPPSVASSHLLRRLPLQGADRPHGLSPAAPSKGARCPCGRPHFISTSRRNVDTAPAPKTRKAAAPQMPPPVLRRKRSSS